MLSYSPYVTEKLRLYRIAQRSSLSNLDSYNILFSSFAPPVLSLGIVKITDDILQFHLVPYHFSFKGIYNNLLSILHRK